MIDSEGYRANIGIIVSNHEAKVLWARRLGQQDAWQFPQGGMKSGESAEDTLYRELQEELGLAPEDVEILGSTHKWLRYKLPKRYIRHHSRPVCIGQKQRWFLLQLTAGEDALQLDAHEKPEFDHWKWVDYWHPPTEVIVFKREVYQRALTELQSFLQPEKASASSL